MALDVLRTLMLATEKKNIAEVSVRVNEKVASYLNNQKRRELAALEGRGTVEIRILGSETVFPEHLELECRDDNGRDVPVPVVK
jgi:ribonuclease E